MQQIARRIFPSLLLGLFLLYATALNAADLTTRLTLSEAIQTALSKNPKISAAAFQVEGAQAQITQARGGLLPQLQFSESFNRTTNPMWAFGTKLNQETITTQDFDPARLNDPDPINNFASTLSLHWSLYDGGQTRYGIRQAHISQKMTTLALEQTRQQVIAQTATAFSGLLLAQEHLTVVGKSLETAQVHLKMVQNRLENGLAVKSDLLRAQVHIADLQQQQLQAESQVEVARSFLNAAMGVAVDQVYELDKMPETDRPTARSLDQWIDTALLQRPELKQLEQQELMARDEISKSQSAHHPSVSLMGSYEFNTEDFSQWGNNYTVGAMVSLNLFSGGRLSAKTVQAKAALNELSARQEDLKQGIVVQTRQAFLQAQSARKRIRVAEQAVTQAQETVRIVANRYHNGLLTIVTLLDAELALQQARTHHFKALHDYKVAEIQLALAAGTIDENFQ